MVVHIGGNWDKGRPTRSTYHFDLLADLCRNGKESFYLAQDFYWFNPARLPSPAQWVTVKRVRAKDAVDPIWWLSKTADPKADNRKVLVPYSKAMRQLLDKGHNSGPTPSGHRISEKFQQDNGGAIPPNLLAVANTESNSLYLRSCREAGVVPHPARYPIQIPQFFIDFLTDEGNIVLDPFAGSNVTGEAAEISGRRWIAFEKDASYLRGSAFRFSELSGTARYWTLDEEIGVKQLGLAPGEQMRERAAPVPLGRISQPEDVSNVVAFLASPDAAYIT